MRAQLAQPSQTILSPQSYLQFMTMHGTGMIAVTITPLALGLGVYLVPLQVGPRGSPRPASRCSATGCTSSAPCCSSGRS
jgi:cytochrome c oxidase subunit 1